MAILGTAGDDKLFGTPDADTIRGRGGNDSLFGEEGNDKILGNGGNDFLVGNSGDDNLIGGQGEDTFVGGRGKDRLNGKDTPAEVLDGSGFDVVNYSSEEGPLGVTVNLATGLGIDTYGHSDKLIDIESVFGTNLADRLIGGNTGNDGFEDFRGLGGNDTIDGGSGFDRVTYSNDFGAGGTQGVKVNLVTGKAIDGFGDTDRLTSIEAVRSTAFDDRLVGDGGDNRFEPLSGADYLHGGGGTDRVAYHNDHFFLGNGNYVVGIDADLAKKQIVDTSGVHVDTVIDIENVTGSNLDDVIRGNAKANRLDGRDGDDLLIGRGGGDGLNGNGGNDDLRGGGGNDWLFGDSGNDLLLGGGGSDDLFGHTGNDVLSGGGGNDMLDGGVGDDVLNGGRGDDILRGGDGVDIFTFNVGDGHDIIEDFQNGTERMEVVDWGYSDGSEVVALATQVGSDVVISNSGDSITLINFDLADLNGHDFIVYF